MRLPMLVAFALLALLAGSAQLRAAPPPAALAALIEHLPGCAPDRAHCLEIQLHVAATGADDAGLVASAAWLRTQLATANHHFAPLGVGFQLAGARVLPAAAAHLRTRADRSALGRHLGAAVIDVFITGQLDNVDDVAVPVSGVAWRKGARKFLIVAAYAREHVLAHELGHFFGLPHSRHAISIMNKTPRAAPPLADRTFAAPEITRMRGGLARLLRTGVIAARSPAGAVDVRAIGEEGHALRNIDR